MLESVLLTLISVALGYVVDKIDKLDQKVDEVVNIQHQMVENTRKRSDD